MARKNKNTSTNAASRNGIHRFEFQHGEASAVCIAGSFNDWHPSVTPMVALGDGRWVKELTLPPGRYEYRFVVDGKWADDPKAKEVASNPHGGVNGVLTFG